MIGVYSATNRAHAYESDDWRRRSSRLTGVSVIPISPNDQDKAQQLAGAIVKKGEVLGKQAAKRTMIARQVLEQLHTDARVSRKTQLSLEDVARRPEEPLGDA